MLKTIIPKKLKKPTVGKSNKRKIKTVSTNASIEHQSYNFVVLVGYTILGLIFLDYLNVLIPPQFFNPNWELETIGRIIETIWILLLGFMLVFFRTQQRIIKQRELKILSLLSWLTLVVAILCFLAMPLLVSDAIRIHLSNKTQINAQLTSQNKQVEQVFLQINQASDQEINSLLATNQIPAASGSIQDIKKQLKDVIDQKQQIATEQLQHSLKNKQRQLFKTTFKWLMGAIISGIAFVTVWKYTSWAREIRL